ncbi:MAG TPA: hypothetical protein DCY88_13280 [Cyanobacteria bacterium UBA11372]|nr:hypothetical protein [Cyanobacteria bacterium UBA11372]
MTTLNLSASISISEFIGDFSAKPDLLLQNFTCKRSQQIAFLVKQSLKAKDSGVRAAKMAARTLLSVYLMRLFSRYIAGKQLG